LFRDGMHFVLRQLDKQADILDANNFLEALDVAEKNPDLNLVLLDLNMPGSDGLTSVKLFHARYPNLLLVVVSGSVRREEIEEVMNNGAVGFISKTSTSKVMVQALRMVLDGGVYVPPQLLQQVVASMGQKDRRSWRTNEFGLTARQVEVLQHLAQGLSNRDIAEAIGLAEGTVKIHVAAILHALRVNNRLEAVYAGQRLGLVAPHSA
jgi:DNA-binding NarL/FixJ family response regulator